MQKILVISGHPNLKTSKVTKIILEKMAKALPNTDFLYLDTTYPDYQIDVAREYARLVRYDVIILQFPITWHSAPSLLKRYIDDLLFYNFATDSKGGKLKGKKLMLSVTAARHQDIYQESGYAKCTLDQCLYCFDIIARDARMEKLPNVYIYGMGYSVHSEVTKLETLTDLHVKKVQEILETGKTTGGVKPPITILLELCYQLHSKH
ncbi:NAD(P)H-dependent oxidoreductase [Helicobacter suis]|uniref:NAD(P)H dehydrogenase n=1 Tax=Helicobacter suis TaxID=104628 RepID=A0A6J4CZH5_9HELI|nr:NAD(P)H-dependent oxidoreductase [Helicobacter suis]BCD70869.1 NAD(P)H dehydrogenase [Helicobacter suis]